MNTEQLKGKWTQLGGEIKRKWGKLTDDDLKTAEGDADKLVGLLQERYGIGKDEAEKEVNSSIDSLK